MSALAYSITRKKKKSSTTKGITRYAKPDGSLNVFTGRQFVCSLQTVGHMPHEWQYTRCNQRLEPNQKEDKEGSTSADSLKWCCRLVVFSHFSITITVKLSSDWFGAILWVLLVIKELIDYCWKLVYDYNVFALYDFCLISHALYNNYMSITCVLHTIESDSSK